jgi:nicotinamidase-related amidase
MRTALAVIDMQDWMFRNPDRVAKLPPLINGINRALAEAGTRGWVVFEIRTEWPPDPSAWSLRAQRANAAVLLAGSADVLPVPGIRFPAARGIITKTRHSAFIGTDFEARLRSQDVSRLLLAGCWLDGCVTQTAIDAYERNIDVQVLTDAVASLDEARAEFARQWANHLCDIAYGPLAQAQQH